MSQRIWIGLVAAIASATALAAQQPATPQPPAAPQAKSDTAPPRPAAQLANVRIELTITDQREGVTTPPKIVSMVVADREGARIRTGTGDLMLNVDARPEIYRDGKIRVYMSMEYRPQRAEAEKNMVMTISESLSAILDDGKPLVVSQSADPASNRTVRVEMKATIQK